jgi:hypothetical protein
MTLISLLIAIALAGFVIWIILQIPMPEPFRRVIVAIACVVLIVWVLQTLGLTAGIPIRIR